MSRFEIMRTAWMHSLFVGVGLLSLAAMPGPTQGAGQASDSDATRSYTWSAELVALDKASQTATVKARVVSHADIRNLGAFEAGDRVMLTWSGVNSAAGIRDLTRGSQTGYDRMTMPVVFVSADADGRYVTFKVPVPSDALGKLESLSAGAWVTATSPSLVSNWKEAVSAIRPYNDVS